MIVKKNKSKGGLFINEIIIEDNIAKVKCSNSNKYFIIDKSDIDLVSPHTWRCHRGQIETNILYGTKWKHKTLSRLLISTLDINQRVRHRNGISLDYR